MIKFITKTHVTDIFKDRLQVSLLYVQDTETGKMALHPLNDFLIKRYVRNSRYNTERAACSYVARFLNWAMEFGITDLADLDINDIEYFISEIAYSGNLKIDSIEQMKIHLGQFANYLEETGISPNLNMRRIEKIDTSGRKRLKPNIVYSKPVTLRKEVPNKIRMIKPKYFFQFLNCAVKTAPEIALGVLFSFSGGLRASEVVNLSKDSYTVIDSYGSSGFILDVKVRNLRDDLITGEVKKNRKQRTIPLGHFAEEVFKMHMTRYLGEGDALFVNRNGKAMSVRSYMHRFNKIKEAFIKELEDSENFDDYNYAQYLKQQPWSTHIGRGTYSNIIAKVCGGNAGILAAARGDSSPTSFMPYMDMAVVMDDASKVLNEWYKEV